MINLFLYISYKDKQKIFNMEDFLNKLFTSREIAHVLHLEAQGEGSYAKHVALQDYYDGIVELIDDLAETYQGQYGLLDFAKIGTIGDIDYSDNIKYFEDLTEFVVKSREGITKDATHLNNQLDDIISLLYKTLYKLKNLK
jgi:DNA-binding ferritin-like protein